MRFLRGWFGEQKATFYMWLSLDGRVYRKFHNIIIPGRNGTAQIDHLLISPYGIFIVETKNISGWIFGDADKPKWTSVLYGKKYPFQNPLRQTYRQKMVLAEYLEISPSLIHTIVFFVGDSKFKTKMPENVMKSGVGRYIKRFQSPILSQGQVDRLAEMLEHNLANSSLTNRQHVKSLRERHSSIANCPKCGSKLVERSVKSGPRTGSRFLGCSGYPKCSFTKNI